MKGPKLKGWICDDFVRLEFSVDLRYRKHSNWCIIKVHKSIAMQYTFCLRLSDLNRPQNRRKFNLLALDPSYIRYEELKMRNEELQNIQEYKHCSNSTRQEFLYLFMASLLKSNSVVYGMMTWQHVSNKVKSRCCCTGQLVSWAAGQCERVH